MAEIVFGVLLFGFVAILAALRFGLLFPRSRYARWLARRIGEDDDR
jgi:hypothetical protein